MSKIFSQLNVSLQCKKYGLSIWQCPQFLFIVMGVIIIATSVAAFFIGTFFVEETELVAMMVLFLTAVLMIIASIIVSSFEKLGEANRMKTEFISIVSHQLRAPISNLRWAIEMLMSGRLGPIEEDQLDYFKIIKDNNGRMKELVNDLLVVSRVELKSFSPVNEKFSLKEMTEKIINQSIPFAQAANVEISLDCPDNLPLVFADPSQVVLVVENLIDNAIRYTKEKGKVRVRIFSKDNNIRFEVADSGVGIPQRDQRYIFTKFFRSGNALKQQTQGSGLGLYIAKAAIEKAKGKIGFFSEEGKGTTFWFTLPKLS